MHKVTKEQMDSIIACMTDPVNGKHGEVFDALELNPYDYCQNGGELEFIITITKSDLKSRVEEAQEYPEDYFFDERVEEIKSGETITAEEVEEITNKYFDECREDESANYATISEIKDLNRSVYTAYTEACYGQGGIHINDFLGFYISDQAALHALSQIDDMIFLGLID